jgi:hypothetical protein
MHFWSIQCMLHAPLILFSLISSFHGWRVNIMTLLIMQSPITSLALCTWTPSINNHSLMWETEFYCPIWLEIILCVCVCVCVRARVRVDFRWEGEITSPPTADHVVFYAVRKWLILSRDFSVYKVHCATVKACHRSPFFLSHVSSDSGTFAGDSVPDQAEGSDNLWWPEGTWTPFVRTEGKNPP